MYIEKKVIVEDILYEDQQIQLLKTSNSAKKAILYLPITPRAAINDEVIVNCTATKLALGTGGMDIVVSVIGAKLIDDNCCNGHIMKARYLPNQHSVLCVEAQESDYHDIFNKKFCLNGKKILLGELHSMIPICFWAMDYFRSDWNMVVIISDEASIPLSLSRNIRELKKDDRFSTITIGQAFGGTYEAVNLETALQFATEVLKGDTILISLGPGVVGTDSRYGFSGMALASWANSIGSLGGIPVWIPRISEKDVRKRHQGISHHTLTPLMEYTYPNCIVPLPQNDGPFAEKIKEQARKLSEKHTVQWIDQGPLIDGANHCEKYSTIPIRSMGRNYKDDPLFFLAVIAGFYSLL